MASLVCIKKSGHCWITNIILITQI